MTSTGETPDVRQARPRPVPRAARQGDRRPGRYAKHATADGTGIARRIIGALGLGAPAAPGRHTITPDSDHRGAVRRHSRRSAER